MISKGVKSIFPIKNQEIWDRYKQHIQAFWTTEEVSLQDDLRDLETLNDGEFISKENMVVSWTAQRYLPMPKIPLSVYTRLSLFLLVCYW